MEAINAFILDAALSPWLLLVMFLTALIDGFFPPIPSETLLVAAAAVAASSGDVLTLVLLCVVAAIGVAAGDGITYEIARKVGTRRFSWMRGARATAALDRAEHALRRRGAPLILGARYIPLGRTGVNLSAGAVGFPRARFLALSLAGGGLWVIYSAVIGVVAEHVLADQPLLSASIGVAFALLLGVVIDRIAATRRRSGDAAASAAAR